MTILTTLIGLSLMSLVSFAEDFDRGSYRYKIFDETVEDKAWIVQASNGLYECKATIKCPGLNSGMIIRSRKPTWYDPLTIHYVVDSTVRSCEFKSCLIPPEPFYDYYR
tara:strand:- start:1218 stop:1544 length:327 start_codon:yes stop_codon:yes gene_type:complete